LSRHKKQNHVAYDTLFRTHFKTQKDNHFHYKTPNA